MSKELVKKAKDGNTEALNMLINNHKELAFSIAFKHLKDRADAEDVVQDSFVIVLKAIKNFRNEAKFSTWLYRIVYHECLKKLRNKNQPIEYLPQFIEAEDEDVSYEQNVNIDDLLKALRPLEYSVITLFYLEEKSIADIMKITSLGKANVKVILHRARAKMKQAINLKPQ